jgi:serine/threonine protein phosphatase PrpC
MSSPPHRPSTAEPLDRATTAAPDPVGGPDDTLPVLGGAEQAEPPLDGWPVELDISGATDRGLVRARNEDHYLVADLERQMVLCDTSVGSADDSRMRTRREGFLFAVADGMGGHAGGAMASQVVLDALAGYLLQRLPWHGIAERDEAAARELDRALAFCQRRLDQVADRKGLLMGHPGTTLTAAFVSWPGLLILHVGDSRLYLHRAGTLTQLTTDHTLLQDDTGHKVAAGAPMRHVLLNAIVSGSQRAVGEVRWLELAQADTLLLCTDGLTEHVSDEVLTQVLARGARAADTCAELIDLARKGGGSDNITVVVTRFQPLQG